MACNNPIPECSICNFVYDNREHKACVLLRCGHIFCKKCISEFRNGKCPNCMTLFEDILSNIETYFDLENIIK